MKAGTEIKISNYTLYALLLAIVVVLVMFFFVGSDNKVAIVNECKENCEFVTLHSGETLALEKGEFLPEAEIAEKENMAKYGVTVEIDTDGSPKLLSSPKFTGALISMMYILVVIPIVLIVVYMLVNYVLKLIENPVQTLKSSIPLFVFVFLAVVIYLIANSSEANSAAGEPLLINGEAWEDYGSMVITDFFLFIQYVLLVVCVIATIVSLTGVVKYVNKVKSL